MAGILINAANEVKSQFSIKEVDSSNTVFKLFSKVTVGLCVIASILVASSEYIGSPITCLSSDQDKIPGDVFNAYCWIHGGKKIHEKYQKTYKCHAPNQDSISDTNDTLYYQWVVFMLAINAMIFRIPHILWKFFEGGVMKNFHTGKGLKSDLMNNGDDMEKHLKTHIAYFKKLRKKRRKNISYYAKFQGCQILNIMMLVLNFVATNQFLSSGTNKNLFYNYGSDVVNFSTHNSTSKEGWFGRIWDPTDPGPMCNTFPTVISCEMMTVGKAGAKASTDGICILSQNIINEKIYLFLWFWFVFLFVASGIQLTYDIAILSIGAFRSWLMEQQFGGTDDPQMKDFVQNLGIGDWFVLHQIGKNTNEEFFHKLIQNLSGSKANDVEENAPLMDVAIDAGNGMELRQRNQAE